MINESLSKSHVPSHPVDGLKPVKLQVKPTLESALMRAKTALLGKHAADGYWVGELQGDSILQSEYILLKFILRQEDDPQLPRIANHLRNLQQSDGGWSMYTGGASDISGTVKGYFALKLM